MAIFETRTELAASCCPEKLLSLVVQKDDKAMEALTLCYGNRLLEIGRHRCRNEEQAKDARQDALLSATLHLEDFRGEGSLEGWLAKMVINACHHMRRGRKADASLHTEVLPLQQSDDSSPDELAMQAELGKELGEALQVLAPEDRAIVMLAEVNGWKGPEIAEAMSMSAEQVRTRLSRSRRRLRELLSQTWPDWASSL